MVLELGAEDTVSYMATALKPDPFRTVYLAITVIASKIKLQLLLNSRTSIVTWIHTPLLYPTYHEIKVLLPPTLGSIS